MDKKTLLGALIGIGAVAMLAVLVIHKPHSETESGWQWGDSWSNNAPPPAVVEPVKPGVPVKPHVVADSYTAAIKQSGELGMPVLVYFGADWCKYCKNMQQEVLPAPAVQAMTVNYIFVHVNADQNKDVMKKFGISGIPAYVITNHKEEKLKMGSGYKSPDQFSTWLNEPNMFSQPKATSPEVTPKKPEEKPEEPKKPRRRNPR